MPSMPEASNYLPGGSSSGYNAGQLAPAVGAGAGAAAVGAGAGAMAGMSAKQREAYQERQRLQVNNQQPGQGGSGSGGYGSDPTSPVTDGGRQTVVSQDAGPVGSGEEEPFQQGGEVPPT
jgi:hypothetical protein